MPNRCGAVLLLALTLALTLAAAVPAARADSANSLLNRYYMLRDHDPAGANAALQAARIAYPEDPRPALEDGYRRLAEMDWAGALVAFQAALALQPDHADLWAQIGYLQIGQNRHDEAIAAFRRAALLAPEREDYLLQAAYLEQQDGRRADAMRDFRQVAGGGAARAEEACQAWRSLQGDRRLLPEPWFAEAYAAPEWRRRNAVGVLPVDLRLGATAEAEHQLDLYGSLRTTADNRSSGSHGPDGPVTLFDNAAVLAAGLRGRPVPEAPLTLFAEAGMAHDLIARDRPRDRGDLRGGAILYQDWNMTPGCAAGWTLPLRPVADLYGDAVYFSRYRDAILYLRGRPGLRIVESDSLALDAYALLALGSDTAKLEGARYQEAGPGIALRLLDPLPVTLRGEAVRSWHGDGNSYGDRRVRLDYAVRF